MRRFLSLAMALATLLPGLPVPAGGQGAPADSASVTAAPRDTTVVIASPDSVRIALERARESLRDADYDRAIETLKPALDHARGNPQNLRDVYMLLIKTYVFLGNDLKFKPQGREASNLNYQEARRLIAEVLGVPALRHVHPDPAMDPPEMVAFFAETRRQIFGAFRVRQVFPTNAVVLFDGDTLRALPGETQLGDVDIAIGPHAVVVRGPGYKETTERVTIEPNVTLERTYRLVKRRGAGYYATRWGGALAAVGGLVAAVAARGAAGTASLDPLEPAPDPPQR